MESENLRLILPLLRPRSGEPTWYNLLLFIVLCIGLATLAVLYILRNRRQAIAVKKRFRQRGRELKLKPAQTTLLYAIAQDNQMNNPLLLLSSIHIFDQYVGAHTDMLAKSNETHPQLNALDDIRTWLGFDQVPHGHLLHSTRQMPIGQSLDLSPPNTDENDADLTWVVTERRADALLISPLISQERLEKDQRRAQRWRAGQPLEATFWHADGIEYVFTTTVLSVPASHQLALAHSNDVLHTQQRHFLRIDADFPLTLYALPVNDAQSLIQSLVQTLAAHTDSQAMPPSAGGANGAQNDFPINLENLASIQCQAVDLSAGGLGLISDAALPEAQHFLLDPKFSGDYPLAGLLCQQVRRYRSSQSYHLQTQFIDLPLAIENELVRLINQHQITAHQPTPASPSSSGNTS